MSTLSTSPEKKKRMKKSSLRQIAVRINEMVKNGQNRAFDAVTISEEFMDVESNDEAFDGRQQMNVSTRLELSVESTIRKHIFQKHKTNISPVI
ncbi:2807_t:CDS:2 [Entrophospora sp. SA101]|nr:2807_t:CDS:2 [Entrophospora sp. SA101]